MYEIWLMLNIVYEVIQESAAVVVSLTVLWLALMALARQKLRWETVPRSILLGLSAGLVFLIALPGILASSFADMGYWVDWANLIGLAAAGGALVAAFAWPVFSVASPPKSVFH
jgi:L-cystine uptake protein TcyP (sodium:dicarboxylate symporter family)